MKDTTTKLLNTLSEEIDKLRARAEESLPTPYSIKSIKSLDLISINTEYLFKLNKWGDLPKSIEQYENKYKSLESEINKYLDEIKLEHERNIPLIEHNKKVKNSVKEYMKLIGIRDKYSTYTYKSTRSRNKTWVDAPAGYISDLNRVICISDLYNERVESCKYKLESLLKFKNTKVNELKGKEKELKEQKEKQDKDKLLAQLKVKYNLPFTYDEDNILYEILNKNKYLNLAHSLLENRHNWNDGYSLAKSGLEDFEVVSDLDNSIYNDIYSYFDNFTDGRVFRDCTYNYNFLFNLVNEDAPDLFNDYNLLTKYINND